MWLRLRDTSCLCCRLPTDCCSWLCVNGRPDRGWSFREWKKTLQRAFVFGRLNEAMLIHCFVSGRETRLCKWCCFYRQEYREVKIHSAMPPAFHGNRIKLCPPNLRCQTHLNLLFHLLAVQFSSSGIAFGSLCMKGTRYLENNTRRSVGEFTCMPKYPSPKPLAI